MSSPIKINLDLEIFKVKRFALNHKESLGKSESLLKKSVQFRWRIGTAEVDHCNIRHTGPLK